MIAELLSEVDGQVGPGLVQVACALPGLLDSSLQLLGQEKHFRILFTVRVRYSFLYRHALEDNGRPSMFFSFVHSLVLSTDILS